MVAMKWGQIPEWWYQIGIDLGTCDMKLRLLYNSNYIKFSWYKTGFSINIIWTLYCYNNLATRFVQTNENIVIIKYIEIKIDYYLHKK